jgi:hypothetical protein
MKKLTIQIHAKFKIYIERQLFLCTGLRFALLMICRLLLKIYIYIYIYIYIERERERERENVDVTFVLPQDLRLKIPESQRSLILDPYILDPKTLFPASLRAGQHLLRSHFP